MKLEPNQGGNFLDTPLRVPIFTFQNPILKVLWRPWEEICSTHTCLVQNWVIFEELEELDSEDSSGFREIFLKVPPPWNEIVMTFVNAVLTAGDQFPHPSWLGEEEDEWTSLVGSLLKTYILYSITYLWLITYYKRHSNYLYWKNRPSQIHSSLSFYEGSIKLSEWRAHTIHWALSIGVAGKFNFWIQSLNLNIPLNNLANLDLLFIN